MKNAKVYQFQSNSLSPNGYQPPQMAYQWKQGSSHCALNAQVVGEELERIRAFHDGELYTADVVESAKDKKSPIHDGFTWDNSVAGHNWRLHEARQMIRLIYTVSPNSNPVPEYINVQKTVVEVAGSDEESETSRAQYYQSRRVLPDSPDEYQSALRAAQGRLESARKELGDLHSIARKPKQIHIEKAQQRVEQAQQALASAA